MTRIVQCLSHSIEAYDSLRLFTSLGFETVDIGGYIVPSTPHDPKRPGVPEAVFVPEILDAINAQGSPDNLGAAQAYLPDAVLDWLGDDGVVMYDANMGRLFGQWPRLRDWKRGSSRRRIVWRSIGQSVENNENEARPFRADGLERVAYSPKEANIPGYTGHDAIIRFYKDPDEYTDWTGETNAVLNIAQHHEQPHARDVWLNFDFFEGATRSLPRIVAGTHSEKIGGRGQVSHDEMHRLLRTSRAYLYTGTQPASYTLGLIEAMMTGIPVVSIGRGHMTIFPYGPDLFEELVPAFEDPADARDELRRLLTDDIHARVVSYRTRDTAVALFGRDKIGAQWREFLG